MNKYSKINILDQNNYKEKRKTKRILVKQIHINKFCS